MEPNNDRGDGSTDTMASLEQRAVEARQAGDFDRAARLFALAATSADQLQRQLHLQIRQACCLLAIERYSEAAALATVAAGGVVYNDGHRVGHNYVEGLRTAEEYDKARLEAGNWRVEVKPGAPRAADSFLHVLTVAESPSAGRSHPAKL